MKTETFLPSEKNHVIDGIYRTSLDGLFFSASQKHTDHRGHYAELVRIPELNSVIQKPFVPVQINHSHSRQNVIRGFHAENWNKLVTIVHGYCYCVLVDVRPHSDTFGQSVSLNLGDAEQALYGSLYIPAGIANSALALSDPVEYLYFVDALYSDRDRSGDVSISLFDNDIDANWPIPKSSMIISERDRKSVQLRKAFPGKFVK